MKVEVRIVPEASDESLPENQRPSLHIETHERRGDAFTVQRNDTVLMDKNVTTFVIPNGGRLVVNSPATHEELVYDRDQAAAVRGSTQRVPHKADSPAPQGTRQLTSGEAAAKALEGNPTTPATTNPTPTGNTQSASNVPADNAQRAAVTGHGASTPAAPAQTSPSGSRITPAPNTPDPSKTEKK